MFRIFEEFKIFSNYVKLTLQYARISYECSDECSNFDLYLRAGLQFESAGILTGAMTQFVTVIYIASTIRLWNLLSLKVCRCCQSLAMFEKKSVEQLSIF